MKGKMSTELGSIVIDTEAIAQYAGSEAMECFGIVGMAAFSVKDGFVSLLMQDNLSRGINVKMNGNALIIDFHVIVAYGVSIQTVARNLIDSVQYKLERYTGFKVDKINIYVEDVRVID
ncbi:MAG: Asp23/Gls24 family envelope stress response protein [Lachnospiraceae bacterium]|nr:Asp23/Gls24 family envelope stress response protein [Lachnospiraceae bacterium]MDN4743488.1 Asp23/Gls24 family envelope stress response protein [Lachnospiraceae bacterium C1.1]